MVEYSTGKRIMTMCSMAALVCLAVGLVASQTGCVATAAPPPPRGVVVSGPPPSPVDDVRSSPPNDTASWVGGYWHWTGAQYAWIPGHWESAPPGATWYAPRYVTTDGSTFYEPGRWRMPSPREQQGARAFH